MVKDSEFNNVLSRFASKLSDAERARLKLPKIKKQKDPRRYECPACMARFERVNQLKGHIRQSPRCQDGKPSQRKLKRKDFADKAKEKYRKLAKKKKKKKKGRRG